MNALLTHFWLTLVLNLRNKQALIFGYVVPAFFLVAFGSIYYTRPPLMQELGQILTISIMGGACFGLPVTIVSERERGVWRRYRLTPVHPGWLMLSLVLSRYVLVLTSALLQIGLALLIYKMPFPNRPFELFLAFTLASFAFLCLGLVIAMLAKTAQAVQAFGQMLFLPMIILGGVAVPLTTIPEALRPIALFLPGFHAVRAMDACVVVPPGSGAGGWAPGLDTAWFHVLALLVMGGAALLAAGKLFRWEPEQRLRANAKLWAAVVLLAWIAAGAAALSGNFVKLK